MSKTQRLTNVMIDREQLAALMQSATRLEAFIQFLSLADPQDRAEQRQILAAWKAAKKPFARVNTLWRKGRDE